MLRVKAVFAVLLFASICAAGPYADAAKKLQGRPDKEAISTLRALNKEEEDEEAQHALLSGAAQSRAYINLRATLEGEVSFQSLDANPITTIDSKSSSWLARALDRLKNLFKREKEPEPAAKLSIGSWLEVVVWGFLFLAGSLLIYLLVRYVSFPKRNKSILEPNEQLRSAESWLDEVGRLMVDGKYRDAVRSLYVAGLIKIDQAGVAKFDPNQTNWEHLRRIKASPKRPADLDIRTATQRFDRCWYGHLPTHFEDAVAMRNWYDDLVIKLGVNAA